MLIVTTIYIHLPMLCHLAAQPVRAPALLSVLLPLFLSLPLLPLSLIALALALVLLWAAVVESPLQQLVVAIHTSKVSGQLIPRTRRVLRAQPLQRL